MCKLTTEERHALRELGRRKRQIGELPRQEETARLWTRLNDLQPVRPLVWINQVPWHELEPTAPELRSLCRDPFLAGVETALRQELYQWDHFAGDMVVEPVIYNHLVGGPTSVYADYGLQEKTIRAQGAHDVLFMPLLQTLEDADKIQTPRVWCDRAETDRRLNLLREIFAGVIAVRQQGIVHQWHTPWDQAVHWYGVERLLMDLYDQPEVVARVVQRMCQATAEVLDQQQALGMLDVGSGNWCVGSGGMGYTSQLPNRLDRPATPRDQWGCGNAQVFSEVSPAMHEEFSLRYERPILERFGLAYYGCCEPLHLKMDILRGIANLRKISMSPKADLRVAAPAAQNKYVLSFKPNPAHLATDSFAPDLVATYLRQAVRDTAGCNLEIILKDITTVRNDPARLDQWAKVALAVAQSA